MIFKDYIKTAFKNLRKRKARTFLTSFAVGIATMIIIVMISLGLGAQNLIINEIKLESTVSVKMIERAFAVINKILFIGGIISIFAAVLGIINTMTIAIYERTRYIGIMKAVGASKSTIRKLFIAESAVVGFIGGFMGIVSGWINTKILGGILNGFLKFNNISNVNIFVMPLWLILGSLVFAVMIAIFSGLYPAVKASKIDPVESLRYE